MLKTRPAEVTGGQSSRTSLQASEGRLRLRRLWVWPLRTGLMTVLAVGGLPLVFSGGCGGTGTAGHALPGVEGGGSATLGSTTSHSGGATAGNTLTLSPGGRVSGQGGSSLTTEITLPDDCRLNGGGDTPGIFAAQTFSMVGGGPKVLYSWTTAQQAEELRDGALLFSRSERPDMGRGNALEALARRATGNDVSAQLAGLLSQKVFATARYAWTNPWATRMGWPGEQYGDQLLRIELQDDAWYALFDGQNLWVMNASGQYVPIEEVTANPMRVAAIVYSRGPTEGGPRCSGSFGEYLGATQGSGTATSAGYREIVLGNIGMVKRWSIGTTEIAARLNEDIALLEAFDTALRNCPPIAYDPDWNGMVVCSWNGGSWGAHADYVNALAIPSDYYQPTSENVRRIIDTLKSDGFVIDPYVVE